MKKILFVAVLAVASLAVYAQPRAIGGRLGYGIEFSYEHGFGESNMLSIDAGVPTLFINNDFAGEAVVTYDWINPFGADFSKVWSHKGEWNWYLGVGAGAGFHTWHLKAADTYLGWDDHIFVGVAGRVGVEYNFWFPLQLSVDWRPLIGPQFYNFRDTDGVSHPSPHENKVDFNTNGLYMGGVSLAVRYKF